MNTTDENAQKKREKRFARRRESLLRAMRKDVAKLREISTHPVKTVRLRGRRRRLGSGDDRCCDGGGLTAMCPGVGEQIGELFVRRLGSQSVQLRQHFS